MKWEKSASAEPLVFTAIASFTAIDECLEELWKFFVSEILPRNEGVNWDFVRVEIWLDSGRIIVFPASSGAQSRIEISGCQVVFPSMLEDYERLADSSLGEMEFTQSVCDLERMWVNLAIAAARRIGLSHVRLSFWIAEGDYAIHDEFLK